MRGIVWFTFDLPWIINVPALWAAVSSDPVAALRINCRVGTSVVLPSTVLQVDGSTDPPRKIDFAEAAYTEDRPPFTEFQSLILGATDAGDYFPLHSVAIGPREEHRLRWDYSRVDAVIAVNEVGKDGTVGVDRHAEVALRAVNGFLGHYRCLSGDAHINVLPSLPHHTMFWWKEDDSDNVDPLAAIKTATAAPEAFHGQVEHPEWPILIYRIRSAMVHEPSNDLLSKVSAMATRGTRQPTHVHIYLDAVEALRRRIDPSTALIYSTLCAEVWLARHLAVALSQEGQPEHIIDAQMESKYPGPARKYDRLAKHLRNRKQATFDQSLAEHRIWLSDAYEPRKSIVHQGKAATETDATKALRATSDLLAVLETFVRVLPDEYRVSPLHPALVFPVNAPNWVG